MSHASQKLKDNQNDGEEVKGENPDGVWEGKNMKPIGQFVGVFTSRGVRFVVEGGTLRYQSTFKLHHEEMKCLRMRKQEILDRLFLEGLGSDAREAYDGWYRSCVGPIFNMEPDVARRKSISLLRQSMAIMEANG